MVFWGLLNWGWSSIGSPFSGKQVVSDFSYFRRRKQSVTKLWVPFKGQIQILRVDWKGKATFFFQEASNLGRRLTCVQKPIPKILLNHEVFPGVSDDKESALSAGDPCLTPRSERYPGEGDGIHSSILTWRIPWTEEPGELQSMGSQTVGHNSATNTSQGSCYLMTGPAFPTGLLPIANVFLWMCELL